MNEMLTNTFRDFQSNFVEKLEHTRESDLTNPHGVYTRYLINQVYAFLGGTPQNIKTFD